MVQERNDSEVCSQCGRSGEKPILVPLTFGPSHDFVIGADGKAVMVPLERLEEAKKKFFETHFSPINVK